MIAKPELIKKIRSYFNLNIYETKVWLALLERGVASAGEIAQISGVPRSRTYDVLESLEKRGFAIAKIGKPVKYLAVKPTLVIEKLKANTQIQAKEKIKALSDLKDTKEYLELEELRNSKLIPIRHEEMSSAIRGRSNLFSHLRSMADSAEKEVIIVSSTREIEKNSRLFSGLFDRLNKKKINIKLALNSPVEEIRKISEQHKIRATKTDITGRFFIVDRKQVLFMISPDNTNEDYEIGIWLNSEFFGQTLSYLFDIAYKHNDKRR